MTTEEQVRYVRDRLHQLIAAPLPIWEPRDAESVRQNNQYELAMAARLFRETQQHCAELGIKLTDPVFRALYNYDAELGVEVLYELVVLYDISGLKIERQMATFRVDTDGVPQLLNHD